MTYSGHILTGYFTVSPRRWINNPEYSVSCKTTLSAQLLHQRDKNV